MRLRTRIALLAAQAVRTASQFIGHGGSNLPGRIARRIDRDILRRLARQPTHGNIVITGTNGKTTTAGLVAAMADVAGRRLTHNRAGANLIGGITSAFIAAANWGGRIDSDYGVLEVDEATVPQAVRELQAQALVVTNFFADQIDRFATLSDTVNRVRQGVIALPKQSQLILNADDPEVAGLAAAAPGSVLYFGVDAAAAQGHPAGSSNVASVHPCSRCSRPYVYRQRFYAHLGSYYCPHCGQARPEPTVRLQQWTTERDGTQHVAIATPAGDVRAKLAVPGLYNVYNALAAVAVGFAAGWDPMVMAAGLSRFRAGFGRMERLQVGSNEVVVALVKNPVGCDEVLRTLLHDSRDKVLLFALNDRAGDGTDIAWIWDVHFEWLATEPSRPLHVVLTGTRAADAAIRLKYAGFDPARLHVATTPPAALTAATRLLRPSHVLYILPTYSAMLDMRASLTRLGGTRLFEEA